MCRSIGASAWGAFGSVSLWCGVLVVWIRSLSRQVSALVDNCRSHNSPVSKATVDQIDSDRRHNAASVGGIFISEIAVVCARMPAEPTPHEPECGGRC